MNWYRWKVGRFAYAPAGVVGTQADGDGEWWQIVGPFYWLYVRAPKTP